MQDFSLTVIADKKSMRKLTPYIVTILSVPIVGVTAPCQTSCAAHETAALMGIVRDQTDAIIPGASLALDSSIRITTNAHGTFVFDCVPHGVHQLVIGAPGFASESLRVDTRKAASLQVIMRVATVEQEVSVDSSSADDESASPGARTTLKGDQLQGLSDDPDELLAQLQRLGALNGGNPAETIITVDGFQAQERIPPKSAISYIKVNPDSYSAEYRQPPYAGGRVEIYTKPGQSAFHGSLFVTNSSPWENARDPFSSAKGSIGRQRYGFDLTGPLKKRNSDFFVTLERRTINSLAVVNADTLDTNGSIVNTIDNTPTPQSLWNAQAKVDWQLSSRNTLDVSYSLNINNQENVGVGGNALAETGYSSRQSEHAFRITEITTASPSLMHEAKVALRWTSESDTPVSSSPELAVAGAFIGGGASFGPRQLHEFNVEVDDDIVATTKRHTLKAGTQFMYFRDDNQLTTNFNGAYIFGGGQAPALDSNNQPVPGITEEISALEQYRRTLANLPGGAPTTYSAVLGNPELAFSQFEDALFLQDSFKVTPRLLLSVGFRYFLQNNPTVLNSLTPRFGFNWSPSKSKNWSIHGHLGLFTSIFPTSDTSEVLRQDGVRRTSFMVYNPVYGTPTLGATPIYTQRRFSPHLSNSLSMTENIGGTWGIAKGWTVMADFTLSRIWDDIRSANINSPLNGYPQGPRALAIPQLNLLEMQNSAHASVNNEFLGVQHYERRYSLFLGGVRVDVVGTSDGSHFATAQSAFSDAGERSPFSSQPIWQVFAEGSLNLPYKVQFSEDLTTQGDQHFNITSGFDRNGDGDFNDRPQYALPGSANAIETKYGFMSNDAGSTPIRRNLGVMPWKIYLESNLQRAFPISRDVKGTTPKSLTVNLRSSNLINHTNVLQVGSILGSLQFDTPVTADVGRRIEGGVRFTF